MSTTTAPAPSDGNCRRLRVTGSAAPAGVAAAVAEAVRRQGTVEVEAAGAEALQHAIEGIAAARVALAHDGREIAVAPSLVDDACGRESAMRLRVLRATLSAASCTRSCAPSWRNWWEETRPASTPWRTG